MSRRRALAHDGRLTIGYSSQDVQDFEFVDEILKCSHSSESHIERYVPVVLFIMLYKVVQTFESVDETIKCNYSN